MASFDQVVRPVAAQRSRRFGSGLQRALASVRALFLERRKHEVFHAVSLVLKWQFQSWPLCFTNEYYEDRDVEERSWAKMRIASVLR